MRTGKEMKNLSEDILTSFKLRIQKNDELVQNVKNTLEGFQKDQQEMAAVLRTNATALKKGLAHGEKDRLNTFNQLLKGIHQTIDTIKKDVVGIQTSTHNMINEFTTDRVLRSDEMNKSFEQGRADSKENEKKRMKEFTILMKNINGDIKNINEEVSNIFKNTNDMLKMFENKHIEMSTELREELSKKMAERVEYTRTLLNGFQKRLSEISKENMQMAQNLRKDLTNGESERLKDYKDIMNGIHLATKGIRTEVKEIQEATLRTLGDFAQDRGEAAVSKNIQNSIAQLRKTGLVKPVKEVIKKFEKEEEKPKIAAKKEKEITVKSEPKSVVPITEEKPKIATKKEKEITVKSEPKSVVPITLEEKILDYINKHREGVKISQMEKPLGENRMKLGFVAKNLLELEKIQKVDNIYFPLK
jgi:predicted HicB family RNase H-like nuclease